MGRSTIVRVVPRRRSIRNVAIVGGGPAGAYLAFKLAAAGLDVVIFMNGRRPPLLVGESLVPAIVPFIQELGIEDEVRAYATLKPGATWVLDSDDVMSFHFALLRRARTRYAYNVPRDRFDESILQAAVRAGAVLVRDTAEVERVGGADRVRLSDATLALTGGALRDQPDLIVDATGRARLLSRLLQIPTDEGPRRDTALFAHLAGVPVIDPGHAHIDRLEHGWLWRIPLPDRVSVGIVVGGEHLRAHGATAEEQYDAYIRADPLTAEWAARTTRLTPVMKYNNYQLASRRGFGENWALAGDALGFVDPIFSSGLLISLDGAGELARAILDGRDRAFRRYERHVASHMRSWRRAVDYFYDGRLFTLIKVGRRSEKHPVGRFFAPHFNTHFPRVFTGEHTTNRYSLGLLSFMCRYSLGDQSPERLRIR
jgi:flavin-dependent dehydrogenase